MAIRKSKKMREGKKWERMNGPELPEFKPVETHHGLEMTRESRLKQKRQALAEEGITAESFQRNTFLINKIASEYPEVFRNFERDIKQNPKEFHGLIENMKRDNIHISNANILANKLLKKKE